MSNNIEYINKKISDLFRFVKGTNEFNKKTINSDKGIYPVYSGQTENEGIIGYSNKYCFDGEYIRIITVGDVGNISIIKGKFSLAQNNGVLVPISEDAKNLNLDYIRYILSNNLSKYAKGEGKQKSLLKRDIDNFVLSLPFYDDEYDANTQKKLVTKFQKIEEIKKTLSDDEMNIKNISLEISKNDYNYNEYKVSDIFDLSIQTNSSKFTKTFIRDNCGDIPVYGATKLENEVGYGFVKDNAIIGTNQKVKYFEDCLTYNIDGSAGYIFYRKGRFSLSEKVRPLILKAEYEDLFDKDYLRFVMQPIFRKNIKGRKGPNGENEFTKISKKNIQDLLIPIPIDESEMPDLEMQKSIAQKYMKFENIKKNMIENINDVLKSRLELS